MSSKLLYLSDVNTVSSAMFAKYWLVCHYQLECYSHFSADISTCFDKEHTFQYDVFLEMLGVPDGTEELAYCAEEYSYAAAMLVHEIKSTFSYRSEHIMQALEQATRSNASLRHGSWGYAPWYAAFSSGQHRKLAASVHGQLRAYQVEFHDSVRPVYVAAKSSSRAAAEIGQRFLLTPTAMASKLKAIKHLGLVENGKCKKLPKDANLIL